ncbi:MAG: hypothetical protein QME49_04140, partial [bacterium]|nr:hypothetical protein [bacterium]
MCKKIMLGLATIVSLGICFSGVAIATDTTDTTDNVAKPTIVNSTSAKPTLCPGVIKPTVCPQAPTKCPPTPTRCE